MLVASLHRRLARVGSFGLGALITWVIETIRIGNICDHDEEEHQ